MDAAPAAWEDLARGLGLEPRAPALLGLSGGADSVFLLHLLAESQQRPQPLLAVHIHHGLRGRESDADEQFCRDLCRQLGVELEVLRLELDPRIRGLEQRARDARRAGFARLAAERGIRTVLLAHQREDADETQLLRWLRGSDWAALGALRARRSWRVSPTLSLELVRPLLSMSRAQLRADLERRGLSWREDASNLDLRMARNRVRQRLVPLLGADWIRAARQLRETTVALDKTIETLRPRLELLAVAHALARHPASFSLDLETLRNTHPVLACHALGEALARGTRRRPRSARLEALLELGLGAESFQRRLPGRWRVVGRRGRLELIPPAPTPATEAWNPVEPLLLADGRRLSCEWRRADPSEPIAPGPDSVELACEAPPAQLSVRFDPHGLRFWPLGAAQPTRLVRFLQGAGIPSAARNQIPLVFLGAKLAWVAGVRIAEPLRIREGTRGRLRLRLESGRG